MYRPGREDPDLAPSNGYREASTPIQSLGWYLDAVDRSEDAIENNPTVFLDQKMLDKVETVKNAMIDFFDIDESDIYVTARQNRSNPFYSVKPSNHNFGLKSRQEKQDKLYKPIKALGDSVRVDQKSSFMVKVYSKDQSKGGN